MENDHCQCTNPVFQQSHSIPAFSKPSSKLYSKRSLSDGGGSAWKGTWKDAISRAKVAKDPWEEYDIANKCPTEKAKRYRYHALTKTWTTDDILIKMQPQTFGKGAMRKCFRLKKLSTFRKRDDWDHAANYVAKLYIDDVGNKVYFDDVKLQMDSKVWAEEFNRKNPPKKVDIFQVCVIEMVERPDSPFYHLEHFIEGDYVKYNSNSGFVLADDTHFRMTPQAFSHFTFERSGHQVIVVDIQGVGDLYTDPQIHTAAGTDYGDANLGTKGMALFFASHKCNTICDALGLEPFDLSSIEKDRLDTVIKLIQRDSSTSFSDKTISIGRRKLSAVFGLVEYLTSDSSSPLTSPAMTPDGSDPTTPDSDSTNPVFDGSTEPISIPIPVAQFHRVNYDDSGNSSLSQDDEAQHVEDFFNKFKHRKSSVCPPRIQIGGRNIPAFNIGDMIEEKLKTFVEQEKLQETVLGQVHFELAKYNEAGRFTEKEPDYESALYHLEHAAHSGYIEATKLIALMYLQMPHDILEGIIVEPDDYNFNKGMNYCLSAAKDEDRSCMIIAAKAFDTGDKLGFRERSWEEAVHWYEEALKHPDPDMYGLSADPEYQLYSRMAEMYREGGYGLDKDCNRAGELYNDAAEAAMNAMKGRLANKFYMMAEEVWGEMED